MWYSKKPIIALAPMADMTDSPFCRICRDVSGNDFVVFKEMLSAEALVRDNEKTWKMGEFDEAERPLVIQLLGGEVKNVASAALRIVEKFKPDGIDINMGCPVPKVANRSSAGAALLRDHCRALEIVKNLKKLDLKIPVSVKTRLGWGNQEEILEFLPRLEQAGVDVVTIHGRTKIQGYSGEANWEMIARAKKLVRIPILANGDIRSSEDIKKCLEITGADGVMIGRAALGNPWIFSARRPDMAELKQVVLKHARLHQEHYGEEFGLQTFRKHLLSYFHGTKDVKQLRLRLVNVKTLVDLENCLRDA